MFKILLIDRNATFGATFAGLLERSGYRVEVVATLAEGVKHTRLDPPDLQAVGPELLERRETSRAKGSSLPKYSAQPATCEPNRMRESSSRLNEQTRPTRPAHARPYKMRSTTKGPHRVTVMVPRAAASTPGEEGQIMDD